MFNTDRRPLIGVEQPAPKDWPCSGEPAAQLKVENIRCREEKQTCASVFSSKFA